MSELFETIEMKALDSAERERIAFEEKLIERRRTAQAKRNKATKKLLTRTGIVILITLGLWLAGKFGLINATLVMCLTAAMFMWLAYWAGAWVQFMWCKGGLLKC